MPLRPDDAADGKKDTVDDVEGTADEECGLRVESGLGREDDAEAEAGLWEIEDGLCCRGGAKASIVDSDESVLVKVGGKDDRE